MIHEYKVSITEVKTIELCAKLQTCQVNNILRAVDGLAKIPTTQVTTIKFCGVVDITRDSQWLGSLFHPTTRVVIVKCKVKVWVPTHYKMGCIGVYTITSSSEVVVKVTAQITVTKCWVRHNIRIIEITHNYKSYSLW